MRRPALDAARSGFTLVELVTAASLMTVLMLGVVEVFAIITTTAGEAEGIHFAQRQARATFDRLNTDIRGITREGYLQVTKGKYKYDTEKASSNPVDHQPNSDANQSNANQWYACDSLALVTLGPCRSELHTGNTASEAACAEVLYTNHVKTDDSGGQEREFLYVDDAFVDPRLGVLARGAWILNGDVSGEAVGDPSRGDRSEYNFLGELFRGENNPEADILTSSTAIERVKSADEALHIWPWLEQDIDDLSGGATDEETLSLNRVMGCCVSELYVEVLRQTRDDGNDLWKSQGDTYTWSKKYDAGERPRSWPPAIRVTLVVHDPEDTGEDKDPDERYRGFAMQEIFWLGDP